jgi:uncharacterized protein (TIGR03437 family)
MDLLGETAKGNLIHVELLSANDAAENGRRLTVVIGGLTIPATYAGASSGGTGLNQANVLLPATMAPGLLLPLYLMQGGVVSNTATVAVQSAYSR